MASAAQNQTPKWTLSSLVIALATTLACLTSIQMTAAFFIDERQSPHSSTWDYDNQKAWRQQYRSCSERAQSPIDIQSRFVIANNHLNLHFYNYDQATKFKLSNAHHTIKLEPMGAAYESNRLGNSSTASTSASDVLATADEYVDPVWRANTAEQQGNGQLKFRPLPSHDNISDKRILADPAARSKPQQQQQQQHRGQQTASANGLERNGNNLHNNNNNDHLINDDGVDQRLPYEGAPTIKLDWLDDGNNEYKLRDVHFHWAERRDNGSEHAIDGRRAAMEMHLVHIKHGLDKSKIGITSDSVAVIAILIESYRKSNADFNPIVNALTRINMTDESQEIEYKSIYDLLPSTLNTFWTYSGSLTTPPCYQVVNWIVMSDRLYMNSKQIEMFRNLYAPQESSSTHDINVIPSNHLHNRPPQLDRDDIIAREDELSNANSNKPVPIMPNVRQLQPLNSRTIMASFAPGGRLSPIVNSNAFSKTVSKYYNIFVATNCLSILILVIITFILSLTGNQQQYRI